MTLSTLAGFTHRRSGFPPSLRWLGLLFLVGFAGIVCGQAPAGPPLRTVRTLQQFYDLNADQRREPVALDLECDVTYYDPIWKIMFLQDVNGTGGYASSAGQSFSFSSGDRILVAGTLKPPVTALTFTDATVLVKGPSRAKPITLVGSIAEIHRHGNEFVTLEGLVVDSRRLDPNHLELNVSVEGLHMLVWVYLQNDEMLPDVVRRFVRVNGVYNPRVGQDGALSSMELMVPSLQHLTVLNRLEDDERFERPVTPIGDLSKMPGEGLVRIVGQVKAQDAGRFVRIRDASGQADVLTAQMQPCAINQAIEAIGYPQVNGTSWTLRAGVFRHLSGSLANAPRTTPSGTVVRLAAAVLELAPEEAALGHRVSLTGIVTWSHPKFPYFFVQDSTGGVCVMRGGSQSQLRVPGRLIELTGVTANGPFAPVVTATAFDKISEQVLPPAKPISLEHALTGAEEAQWVEMRGYLRRVVRQDGWSTLEIATAAGDFTALVAGNDSHASLIGAIVRLHGVCTAIANETRKLTGVQLMVPSAAYVQVEESAPANAFDVPLRSLSSLGQFGTFQSLNRRVRVSGVVLHQAPGYMIHIAEGLDALQVFSRDATHLEPGDQIEAVGFLGRQEERLVLREAAFRKVGTGVQPVPLEVDVAGGTDLARDGRLVRIAGRLIQDTLVSNQRRFTLQTEQAIFEAYLDGVEAGVGPASLQLGSDLRVTGVYEVQYGEYGHPQGFQIRLRSEHDLTVVKRPSYLTRERVLAIAGTLGIGILLFIAWVAALRRRVKQQTEQILAQLKRESQLQTDLQRASKLESLGLLAGGIAHDFNNLLTVMMGNLSLIRFDVELPEGTLQALRDAELAAVRARDLTQQLLTFAKGGAPIRAAVSLPDVVREVGGFAMTGSTARCVLDFPEDLWPANVDKGQIGQVVQNIVINATQAMPEGGTVTLRLRNETVGDEMGLVLAPGRYLKLSITDEGAGIAPENLHRIFDPYFTTKAQGSGLGLATVHSIIKKHHGHVSAESIPGDGTTFHIWLPASEVTEEPSRRVPSNPPVRPARQARILFMDDEQQIRQIGQAILQRMGHRVTVVAEGEAAVREYEAAFGTASAFDVVVLDLTVPGGVGGKEAMERLRKLDPQVRAIVSSGYSNDQVLSNHRAFGFVGMVSKPYEIGDLADAVDRVLHGEKDQAPR